MILFVLFKSDIPEDEIRIREKTHDLNLVSISKLPEYEPLLRQIFAGLLQFAKYQTVAPKVSNCNII